MHVIPCPLPLSASCRCIPISVVVGSEKRGSLLVKLGLLKLDPEANPAAVGEAGRAAELSVMGEAVAAAAAAPHAHW